MKVVKIMAYGLMLGFMISVSGSCVWADGGHDRGDHGGRGIYAHSQGREGFNGGFMAENRDHGERRNFQQRNFQQRNFQQRNFQQRNFQQRNFQQRNFQQRNFQQRNVERHNRLEMGRRDFHRGENLGRRPGYILDRRYHHDRYYPPRGYYVNSLPRGYLTFHHHGDRYFYREGIWYRNSGLGFIVVMPPFGLMVPMLPPFYTTIWVAGVPYYYADGIYYIWQPAYQGYVVTAPPAQSDVSTQPPDADQFYVYPEKGQSSQQQATDRYQCHRWAVDQTGFDPSLSVGNLTANQLRIKKSEYRRAIEACLTARGYSVK